MNGEKEARSPDCSIHSSHLILHTLSFEAELQYFVLDSLVAEVWIKGCNTKSACSHFYASHQVNKSGGFSDRQLGIFFAYNTLRTVQTYQIK